MRLQSDPMRCWRTAPTATSEASVMMQVGILYVSNNENPSKGSA